MNISRPFRAPRALLLGVLLVLTLGVVSVLAWQAYQSARSHEQVANGVLRDYMDTACWEFARRATGAIDEAITATIAPLMHEAEEDGDAASRGPLPPAMY